MHKNCYNRDEKISYCVIDLEIEIQGLKELKIPRVNFKYKKEEYKMNLCVNLKFYYKYLFLNNYTWTCQKS